MQTNLYCRIDWLTINPLFLMRVGGLLCILLVAAGFNFYWLYPQGGIENAVCCPNMTPVFNLLPKDCPFFGVGAVTDFSRIGRTTVGWQVPITIVYNHYSTRSDKREGRKSTPISSHAVDEAEVET